jgi:hypothetical protein
LPNRDPILHVLLLLQIIFHLFGQIINYHDQPIDGRECADDPIEDGPSLNRQKGFGSFLRMGA